MTAKLDIYDLFGVLIPGSLLLAWTAVCYPQVREPAAAANFPDAFAVVVLTAISMFLGQLLQAASSLLEPVLFKTWGGRPSDQVLSGKMDSYLPCDSVNRIATKLCAAAGDEITGHSLFLYAMQASESAAQNRIERFNSLYAYHRGLLTLLAVAFLMLPLSLACGDAYLWPTGGKILVVILIPLVTVLVWHRTWQRACYYVREVFFTAERVLDERNSKE